VPPPRAAPRVVTVIRSATLAVGSAPAPSVRVWRARCDRCGAPRRILGAVTESKGPANRLAFEF